MAPRRSGPGADAPSGGASSAPRLGGYLVEFDTVDALLEAARRVREEGYTRWDAHSPFPVHGLDEAMGVRSTRLPWIALGGGVAGASAALLMQWWMNTRDYPYVVAGKPLFSLPASIPVLFELTVLLSAFAIFFGMLGLNGLPRLHHPVFAHPRFRRASADRFFLSLEAGDPLFDAERTRDFCQTLGGLALERMEE